MIDDGLDKYYVSNPGEQQDSVILPGNCSGSVRKMGNF